MGAPDKKPRRFVGRRGPRTTPIVHVAPVRLPAHERAHISSSVTGTISELLVAANLMARGWKVFLPTTRVSRCDLVALSDDAQTVLRIEVRTGRKTPLGTVSFARKTETFIDHHAVAVEGEVHFFPPLPTIAPRS